MVRPNKNNIKICPRCKGNGFIKIPNKSVEELNAQKNQSWWEEHQNMVEGIDEKLRQYRADNLDKA